MIPSSPRKKITAQSAVIFLFVEPGFEQVGSEQGLRSEDRRTKRVSDEAPGELRTPTLDK